MTVRAREAAIVSRDRVAIRAAQSTVIWSCEGELMTEGRRCPRVGAVAGIAARWEACAPVIGPRGLVVVRLVTCNALGPDTRVVHVDHFPSSRAVA